MTDLTAEGNAMTSDDDVRRWWCNRMGWRIGDGSMWRPDPDDPRGDRWLASSDADLGEAVRAWCDHDPAFNAVPYPIAEALAKECGRKWWTLGPIAFMRAVREVVE